MTRHRNSPVECRSTKQTLSFRSLNTSRKGENVQIDTNLGLGLFSKSPETIKSTEERKKT